jgi:hypothetical protein
MKNQYFGDIRDLFKYDLITEIMKGIRPLQKFTFIPMLTPNDNRNDGNKRNFTEKNAGYLNERRLKQFLTQWGHDVSKEKRDFGEIKKYFKEVGIGINIFKENSYFTKRNRSDYFHKVDDALLSDALIFVDPDNGMEIKNNTERHILYAEMKSFYSSMSENSLLMAIQFKHRITKDYWKEYELERRSLALLSIVDSLPTYIADYEIAFFILSKSLKKEASKAIIEYNKKYPQLFTGNIL